MWEGEELWWRVGSSRRFRSSIVVGGLPNASTSRSRHDPLADRAESTRRGLENEPRVARAARDDVVGKPFRRRLEGYRATRGREAINHELSRPVQSAPQK